MSDQHRLSIRAMGAETVEDLRSLWSREPEGWCWCAAWEVETWEGWGDRTAEENCGLRESLWAAGEYHGYVLYSEEEPVGWCRVGPRGSWPKLCRQFELDPAEDVYAFTCFGLRPEARGAGAAHRMMELVLADLRGRGVERVEGFPKKVGPAAEAGQVWTGPMGVFERAGFGRVRELENHWQVGRGI